MGKGGWSIIVHGGAKSILADEAAAHRAGCARAAAAGADILARGGSAVDAARCAVTLLENDPTFNAGHGSVANAAGDIEMDAGIMDGATLAIGAVASVNRIANPIEAAAAMLEAPPILLVGKGAERFAWKQGLSCVPPRPTLPRRTASGHDTVGCVARDQAGHIAAATSTGGLAGTLPGRIGDAPLPGCGFYADDAIGGVSLSGDGEAIARTLLGARVIRAMEDRPAAEAVGDIDAPMLRLAAEAGVIAIDAAGRIGAAHNSENFAFALASSDRPGVIAVIHQDELKAIFSHD
ncbi:MAG: isoaspartyl peptidase/L-asparaginase family protein [Sphingopyxis sp.]|nr:isoaspartyl peptidase/L-asparaginase family protein [Sphingopyxis sp.]